MRLERVLDSESQAYSCAADCSLAAGEQQAATEPAWADGMTQDVMRVGLRRIKGEGKKEEHLLAPLCRLAGSPVELTMVASAKEASRVYSEVLVC